MSSLDLISSSDLIFDVLANEAGLFSHEGTLNLSVAAGAYLCNAVELLNKGEIDDVFAATMSDRTGIPISLSNVPIDNLIRAGAYIAAAIDSRLAEMRAELAKEAA